MFALNRLWNAIATLAGRLEALAGTVATIDTALRERVGLGLDAPADVHVLDHVPPPADDDGQRPRAGWARK
jgi:hypothetical protein